MKPLTYARLGARRYRALIRTGLWQGLFACVLDGTPVTPAWLLAVPGYLYLLAALPLLWAVAGRAWSRTRYGRTCYQDEHRAFDVFVSYRSQNVDAARRFADLALANGMKPWFAEYMIRFHSRDKFQEAINHGIATSGAGIVFTGYGYFDSAHCLTEIRQLVEKNGSTKILEIYSPGETTIADWCSQWKPDKSLAPEGDIQWLANHMSHLRAIRSVSRLDHDAMASAVKDVLGLEIHDRFIPLECQDSLPRFRGDHSGVPFSLQTAGWQECPPPGLRGLLDPELKMTPGFTRSFGVGSLTWEVVLGPLVRRVLRPGYEDIPPSDDDNRWLYNEYRDSAMLWLADNAAECHGVHLFWFVAGERHPHLLVSHWGERMWHRRYAVLLGHDALDKAATFSFAFYFKGSFKDYCRHAPLMDAVVRSLRWER